ncbi:hypothetical protein AXI76_gp048 [Pseudoalteromonas phage H101]|uniref:Uncharacterized protein n=1 Tax=Pseudoalteromonas phage H101 TaxID=1654919 RepID=A0A0H4IN28_9CAUD|nr:hypothetical protein AXI76_gp048 [Pseudoalteromonas phage H101]AKO60949.1 hypothetical protein [Pseudoalteromonas phage H101]
MEWFYLSKEVALWKIADYRLSKHKTKDNWYNSLGEMVLVKFENTWMENKQ